jgi:hypothetical protein
MGMEVLLIFAMTDATDPTAARMLEILMARLPLGGTMRLMPLKAMLPPVTRPVSVGTKPLP